MTQCENCQKEVSSESLQKTLHNVGLLCRDCFNKLCGNCVNCGIAEYADSLTKFDSNNYCNECINLVSFSCGDCGDRYSSNDSCNCSSCGISYCGDCYENDDCRNENESNNYQDQELEFQDGKYSQLLPIKRYVGIELEAENGNQEDLNLPYTFGIYEDGSLNNTGVEVVTPPSTGRKFIENIKLACDQLSNAGFKPTDSCGLHIHIDVRDLRNDFLKLSRILRTYYAIEDTIFAMLPKERLGNQYCYPLRDKYSFYDFYGPKTVRNFDCNLYKTYNKSHINSFKKEKHNDTRYHSANFHSVFYRGSLEIRAHNATQNVEKIINWVAIHLRIVDWAINHFSQSRVEMLLNTPNSPKKVKLMRGVFKFPLRLEKYINSRVKKFGNENLKIDFKIGELPKRKKKCAE